jgi:xylulokinase
MLMYGTTMFLINTLSERVNMPGLWGTVGTTAGTLSLAGGMATSGAITSWLRHLVGSPDFAVLVGEAATSPPGARGLLVLPYFAGERTPVADPDARGVIAGLTLEHTRGDLYRAVLEATALGVRHNVTAIRDGGGVIDRIVAVGGGVQSDLWLQIVSDVTGLTQLVPRITTGASFGAAFLAARAIAEPDIDEWNPVAREFTPRHQTVADYDELYALYRMLYSSTVDIAHALARRQKDAG